jgi:hypothetical protein
LTPLIAAVGRRHHAGIKALIAAGVNVNEPNNKGVTALMVAADTGNVDNIKALIDAGANVNAKDNVEGATALHIAASKGYMDCVKALIAAGGDLDARDKSGRTVRLVAAAPVTTFLRNVGVHNASALEAEIARRDRARITSTNTIKSYSFNSLRDLHLSYAFAKTRYSGPIGLHKSHVAVNYPFFLVFLSPTLDGWGQDEKISSVIGALPSFLMPGDFETASRQALENQTDKLPFPNDDEMLLLTKELQRRT